MGAAVDIFVKTPNPKALDMTINQLGGLVVGGPDDIRPDADGCVRVRCLAETEAKAQSKADMLSSMMTSQGYAEVIRTEPVA